MVIRNAGHSKMSLQTYFDPLMGSALVNLLEVHNCQGIVLLLSILYQMNLFIILSLEWFIFHGA